MAKKIDLTGLGYFKSQENGMVASEYSSSNTYAVGDYVYHSGTLYKCTTAITTAEAWTAAHWTAAKLAEDVGDLKSSTDNGMAFAFGKEPTSWTTGYAVVSTTGLLYPTGTYMASDYVDISGLSSFMYSEMMLTSASGTGGMAFYDSSKTYISGKAATYGSSSRSAQVAKISVPENAKYARFTYYTPSELISYGIDLQFGIITSGSLYDLINKNALTTYGTVVTSGNYSTLGITSVSAIPDNTAIIFAGNITNTMVTDLPEYSNAITVVKINTVSNYYFFIAFTRSRDNVWFRNSNEASWIKLAKSTDTDLISNTIITSMFQKIGVIGDSLAVGWAKDKNGNSSRKNFGISWVEQLERRTGITAYNFSGSGATPITWFSDSFEFADDCYAKYLEADECDLYIIGLGINEGTLGSTSDINQSDYTQNGSTFYGQYARIIQMINHDHPNSIVMCLTIPRNNNSYNTAIRTICGLDYINAELVDLYADYQDIIYNDTIKSMLQPDNVHLNPIGYSLVAEGMMKVIGDYVIKNSSKFKYVGVAEVT